MLIFSQDAIEILEPMTKDSVDFVRQGAFIALGMILVEQSEASSPSLAATRAKYHKVISDKHEDPMARFGAAIGQGFIDAGGRNVTISLQSRAGSTNTSAIVGMVMFCQFWYWYPLAHCACLSFSPTGIIGLNGDLKVIPFRNLLHPDQSNNFDLIHRLPSLVTFRTQSLASSLIRHPQSPPRKKRSRKLPLPCCRQLPKSRLEKRGKLQPREKAWNL